MRIWHWVIAALLLLMVCANAQQSANRSLYPATKEAPVSAALPNPAPLRGQPEPQPPIAAPPASAPSTTVDQVVDRAIEREHALMQTAARRTTVTKDTITVFISAPRRREEPTAGKYKTFQKIMSTIRFLGQDE